MPPKQQQQQHEEAGISSQASEDLANTHIMITKISEQSSRKHERKKTEVRSRVKKVCERYTTAVEEAIRKHESTITQEYIAFCSDEEQVNKQIEELLISLLDEFNAAQGTIGDSRDNVCLEWDRCLQKAQRVLQGFNEFVKEESRIVEQTFAVNGGSRANARSDA